MRCTLNPVSCNTVHFGKQDCQSYLAVCQILRISNKAVSLLSILTKHKIVWMVILVCPGQILTSPVISEVVCYLQVHEPLNFIYKENKRKASKIL